VILEALLNSKIDFPALLCFIDPDIVKKSIEVGIGNEISGLIGGKMDNIFCCPMEIKGIVKNITDGRFEINGHVGKNYFDMGKMAVIQTGNINILAAEKNGPFFEKTVYETAGLDPLEYRMLVVKSPVGFRYAFEDIADKISMVMHPGLSSSDLSIFNFQKAPRPLYPLDEIDDLHI
jgi:microcystin degradation protein MlrC